MREPSPTGPLILALFDQRIEGDHCILELARRRFHQAGLAAEMHPATLEHLDGLMKFRPGDAPVLAHLPRALNLAEESSRARILGFAWRFAPTVRGWIIHDHPAMATCGDDFRRAAQDLDLRLAQIEPAPSLFLEFSGALAPETFLRFFDSIRDLARLSACFDVGHLGLWQVRRAYAARHPGVDVCALKHQPAALPSRLAGLEAAVASALPAVLDWIRRFDAAGKPLHFHLHDGHPLAATSPFGLSDHLGFLADLPLPFDFHGRRSSPLMFGPDGLSQILAQALATTDSDRLSFTLEIHPTGEQLPLGEAAPLFDHWRDKTNAEKMNGWLELLRQNHRLLLEALARLGHSPSGVVPAETSLRPTALS